MWHFPVYQFADAGTDWHEWRVCLIMQHTQTHTAHTHTHAGMFPSCWELIFCLNVQTPKAHQKAPAPLLWNTLVSESSIMSWSYMVSIILAKVSKKCKTLHLNGFWWVDVDQSLWKFPKRAPPDYTLSRCNGCARSCANKPIDINKSQSIVTKNI